MVCPWASWGMELAFLTSAQQAFEGDVDREVDRGTEGGEGKPITAVKATNSGLDSFLV